MNEHRDKPYVKWGLTALVVIFVSILLVVIFTDLPGFFGVLTALEMILEPLIFGVVIAFLLNPIVRFVDSRLLPLLEQKTKLEARVHPQSEPCGGHLRQRCCGSPDFIRVLLHAAAAAV